MAFFIVSNTEDMEDEMELPSESGTFENQV